MMGKKPGRSFSMPISFKSSVGKILKLQKNSARKKLRKKNGRTINEDVTFVQAMESIANPVSYFEQTASYFTSANIEANQNHGRL